MADTFPAPVGEKPPMEWVRTYLGWLNQFEAEVRLDQAKKDSGFAANAVLLHGLPGPGTGPFTRQQQAADEAREQISAKILAEAETSAAELTR